jgi:thioredoxin-related protein
MKITFKSFLLSLLLAIASWLPFAHAEGLPTVKDFTVEAKESSEKQAPILVLFMSKSCSYCETALKDFLLPMQRDSEYDNRVILRQIDTDSKDKLIDFKGKTTTHRAFSNKHLEWGVPTVVLFDSQGNELTSIVGLLTVDFYLAYLDNAISESQAKIKAAEKPQRL